MRIQIDCPEQPTDAIAALIEEAAPSLSEFGTPRIERSDAQRTVSQAQGRERSTETPN